MMKLWAATIWCDKLYCEEVEVQERPNSYSVIGRPTAVGFRSVIKKTDNLLFKTKVEALDSLIMKTGTEIKKLGLQRHTLLEIVRRAETMKCSG